MSENVTGRVSGVYFIPGGDRDRGGLFITVEYRQLGLGYGPFTADGREMSAAELVKWLMESAKGVMVAAEIPEDDVADSAAFTRL